MANPSADPLTTTEDDDLRAKATDRIKRKRALQDHVIVFLIVNTALWLIGATMNGYEADKLQLPGIAGIWLVILAIDAFRVSRGRQGFATLLPLRLGASLPISDEQVSKEIRRMQGGWRLKRRPSAGSGSSPA